MDLYFFALLQWLRLASARWIRVIPIIAGPLVATGLSQGSLSNAQNSLIAFDVPAVVIAEPVNPAIVSAPTMGGELMRLRVPVSTIISPEYGGEVSEYLIELASPNQTLRVVDFWPKDETYSEVEGTVQVETSQQKEGNLRFDLAAAYPTIGSASASGDYRTRSDVTENYQRRPPMHALTNSGTIQQGFGVFYKFRPGPVSVLEGSREVALLVEVPRGWRADLLHVHMLAAGTRNRSPSAANTGTLAYSGKRSEVIATQRLWIATHREGDDAAAAQVMAYVRQERQLRGLANSQRKEINKRTYPTVWHKVGVALDMVDARIPENYLASVLFGPASPHFEHGMQRLPVGLRVAILDYWDQRREVYSLSQPVARASELSMSVHSMAGTQ